MTNKEAIEILDHYFDGGCTDFVWDAYQMAIKALEAQLDKDIDAPNNDTISRQAVVDLIEADKVEITPLHIAIGGEGSQRCFETVNMTCDRHIHDIKQLPSVTPLPQEDRCSECDAWHQYKLKKPCEDAISREAALKIASMDSEIYIGINNLPSVAPDIIRCADCYHYAPAKNGCNGICAMHGGPMDSWDWCSRADRKESR